MMKTAKDNESVNVHRQVKEAPAKAGPGSEKKANVSGAMNGGDRAEGSKGRIGPGETHMKGAISHLAAQHAHGPWKMKK